MNETKTKVTLPAILAYGSLSAGVVAVVCAVARVDTWLVLLIAALGALAGVAGLRWARYRVTAALALVAVVLSALLTVILPVDHDRDPSATTVQTPSAEDSSPSPTSSSSPGTPSASGDLPKIGETAESEAGVAVSVESVDCGLSTAGEGTPAPGGEYCAIMFSVKNSSDQGIDLLATDFEGRIQDASYEAVPGIGRLGDDMSTTTVLSGAAIEGTLFFDVPAGERLDSLVLSADWFELGFDVTAPVSAE